MPGIESWLPSGRPAALWAGGLAIALVAVIDWRVQPNFSLGFLYLLPILWLAPSLRRWELALVAALCGVLREVFSPWGLGAGSVGRIGLVSGVFFVVALVVSDLIRSRELIVEQMDQIDEAVRRRQEAEEQLRVLVHTSPAAILIVGSDGTVLSANEAAHHLLRFEEGRRLDVESIGRFLPALAGVTEFAGGQEHVRTALEERGRRLDGEVFVAQAWFSTFRTAAGPRIAAIVVDASGELRDREGLSLQSATATSRVVLSAFSHEIRNLAGAAQAACANLRRVPGLSGNQDMKALVALVDGLHKIASADLRGPSEKPPSAHLDAVLEDLRIIVEPALRDEGIDLQWEVSGARACVCGDHHTLLQVFMNLARNSQHALRESDQKRLNIWAGLEEGRAVVRFRDSGPGVRRPELLFQPFRDAAAGHGLGLSVSRAMVRSFGGELRHEPQPPGACFAVELAMAAVEQADEY